MAALSLSAAQAIEGRFFNVSKKALGGLKDKLTAALEKLAKNGELAKIFLPYKPK